MDWFTKIISEKLNNELDRDIFENKNLILERKILNKNIEIGNLNSEILKLKKNINSLKEENLFIKSNYIEKKFLNENLNILSSMLIEERKQSNSEEKRYLFDKFIEVLKKIK